MEVSTVIVIKSPLNPWDYEGLHALCMLHALTQTKYSQLCASLSTLVSNNVGVYVDVARGDYSVSQFKING